MLNEIKKLKQNEEDGFRRWFTSKDMDLYVWYDENFTVSSFQLSSSDVSGEYLISWSTEEGLGFSRTLNHFSGALNYKGSTLLKTNPRFCLKQIFNNFISHSKRINRELVRFIINTLIREEIQISRHQSNPLTEL